MSGSGKSTLAQEARRRGYAAYDADDDGFSEPRADGRWGWRADAVASLLAQIPDGDLRFIAGCSPGGSALREINRLQGVRLGPGHAAALAWLAWTWLRRDRRRQRRRPRPRR